MLAGGMDMRKTRKKAAARYRAAVFLMLLGILLPSSLPHGRMEIPPQVKTLLEETLEGEADPTRIAFVYAACAVTDQVGYFWGGKSRALGWDRRWGWPKRVTSPGSGSTGHIRLFGLDCSGLVSWAAATAARDPGAYEQVGEGTREQFTRCVPVDMPRPGDLAFFPDLSHVGIVLGEDNMGTLWVVHCSASRGGVVVTPADVGFAFYGIPAFLNVGA